MSKAERKPGAGMIFMILALAATVGGLVLYYMNATGAYYHDFKGRIPVLSVICLILEVLVLVVAKVKGETVWLDFCYPVLAVLLVAAAMTLLGSRVESAGVILGSDLEASNAMAMPALMQSFQSIGCYFAAMLLTGISGFTGQNKK